MREKVVKIVNIAFPVPAPLHRRIKVAAGSQGLSMSKYLVNLLKREHPRGGKRRGRPEYRVNIGDKES